MIFPGAPNYESVQDGDNPEQRWILLLNKPICTVAAVTGEFNREQYEQVLKIQVAAQNWLGLSEDYSKFNHMRVRITGKLWSSLNGHHHSAVLIQPLSIKRVSSF